ncbi:unnamed protein product [Calicophoron daubneyi]
MDYKGEAYISNPNDLFDIPAAEQEITVGSNEQTVLSSNLISPNNVVTPTVTPTGSLIVTSAPQTFHQGPRPPRVIMVQRSGGGSGLSFGGSPGLKTVKIITVPGQGAGGKPLKAAVIPMHMLQRTFKVVAPGSGDQTVVSSLPRVVTIRAPGQLTAGGAVLGGTPGVTSVRPGTIIFSNAAGATTVSVTAAAANYQPSDEVDPGLIMGGGGEGLPSHHGGVMAAQGYYDLNTGLPTQGPISAYLQTGSPTGRESGDEQEHVPTGLKTNGLRRYARCVCNKVKEKGITSYSEVADELVHEYAAEHPMIPSEQLHYIQKNIRRRVYDALNVLMALNVLQKEKKEIRWVGLPVNMIEECRRLEEEREKSQVSLRNKTAEIQDLILQLIAFKNLVMRNRINDRYQRSQSSAELATGSSDTNVDVDSAGNANVGSSKTRTEKIPLPFLVISTNRKTVIDCNISNDKLEYLFNFDQAFEIRDEVDTLKRMGLMLHLGTIHCTQEEYNQCLELVPPSLRFYVEAIYERRQAIVPDFEALHQQRRLFVEARLAAAAANQNAGQTDENGEPLGPGSGSGLEHPGLRRAGIRSGQPSPIPSGSHYPGLFEGSTGDSTLRQLYMSRDDGDDSHLSGGIPSSGFVPGDTQHYARAAASRGYVVPGGPGGLLRHRQYPAQGVQVSSVSLGAAERPFTSTGAMHAGGTSASSVGGLMCPVSGDAHEDVSAAAALVAGTSGEHGLQHGSRVRDHLVDPEEEIMGEQADDDDEDEDDDDMEEV